MSTESDRPPVDLTRAYGVKVCRADGVKDWTFSTHYNTKPTRENTPVTAIGLAQREAAVTRVHHRYYGPLTVYVWQHRGDDEHYRRPVDDIAQRFHFPAQPLLAPKRPQLGAVD